MKTIVLASAVCLSLAGMGVGFASDDRLPVINGKEAVATVDKEPITVDDVNRGLESLHEEMGDYKKAGSVKYADLVRRLIHTRLILREAQNIGLDDLPEVRANLDEYSKRALIQLVLKKHTENLAPDEAEVDRLYKEEVREYTIVSVMVKKKEQADKLLREIKPGYDFAAVAKKAISDKIAQGSAEVKTFKEQDLLPPIKEAVSKMKPGEISAVIPVPSGFALVKLEEVRLPDDPQAKERARQTALDLKKAATGRDYVESLKKTDATIDQKLLDGVDFEAKEPGFETLLDDTRAVARIPGEDPVTIGDVAKVFEKKFFHGVDRAITEKKLNKRKIDVFQDLLGKRVLLKEARKEGIDKTEAYKTLVEDHRNSILFGVFVEKVIAPGIHIGSNDLTAYYKSHIADFSSLEMMRIQSLVFAEKDKAEGAQARLKKGTDFKWLSVNAEGQIDPEAEGLLIFKADPVPTKTLPEGVQKVLSGARAGEFRIYESPEKRYYVLSVLEVIPPKAEPLAERKGDIRQLVLNEKTKQGVEEWAEKLKKYYPVKVYDKSLGIK